MKKRIRYYLRGTIFAIAFWLVYIYFYYVLVFFGLSEFLLQSELADLSIQINIHLEFILFSLFFGFLSGFINLISDTYYLRRLKFSYLIGIKTGLHIFAFISSYLIIVLIFIIFNLVPENIEEIIGKYFSQRYIISLFVFFFFGSFLLSLLFQIGKRFGSNSIKALLLGYYHKPREEERMFMFLDMKGSTNAAEAMGHNAYSKYLRECYYDLTDIIIEYDAAVYQYVGDEVVLTWLESDGIKNLKCINAFFAYIKKLESRKSYYLQRYGTAPVFKAGLHSGTVTAAEIGEIKTDIAYHGDAVNTTARIQSLCNEMQAKLLISGTLKGKLPETDSCVFEKIGNVELRGKHETISLYRVKKFEE